MIDYNIVILVLSIVSFALNTVYIIKTLSSRRRYVDEYIEAKIDYIDAVAAKVEITDDFVIEYLSIDDESLDTDKVEELIYSKKFVLEYGLEKQLKRVEDSTKKLNRVTKEEDILQKICNVLICVIFAMLVGDIILNLRS